MAELLIWPAVIAYGEAVVAYAGELYRPGLMGRLGTWGVRIGWLAHSSLLVAQALGSDGFPWGTWAGALNLFVWLVVAVYLVWGCKPRFRLLGLVVMPVAATLLVLAWIAGGAGVDLVNDSGALLGAHVALMLAAFAGLTVAAGMAAMYLWEERRLKRRDARLLRLRVPALETLDRLEARITLASLALLSIGILAGLPRIDRGGFDSAMAITAGIWALYATVLVLRREAGLHGRKSAVLQLLGLALVVVVVPVTHFAS
jgi:ABC-type uncharacterized transport system permease subunit